MFGYISLGLLVSVFFLIVVPWLAFSGRREALRAQELVRELRNQVAALSLELGCTQAMLRRFMEQTPAPPPVSAPEPASSQEPASAPELAPAPPVTPKGRKARAAAKALPADMVTAPEPAPAPEAAPEPTYTSPWVPASAAPANPGNATLSAATQLSAKGAASTKDLEEMLGTRWAIWVGGAALALGSLFLVRYTIEAGFFGPLARLTLAALFSAGLVAAGEALRRGVLLPRRIVGPLPPEHAPLALTAAGTVGLFGTVYAAHALYGLIPQGVAFVLLGLIGLAAIAASVVHGQALAGVGLVASYATPLLIGGESRNLWPLVIFLLAVTAAGLAVHVRTRRIWLGWAVVAGVAVWALLLIGVQHRSPVATLAFMLAAMILFAGAFLLAGRPRHALTPWGDPLVLVALSGLLAAIGLSFVATSAGPGLHVMIALLALAVVTAATIMDGRAGFATIAAGLLPLGMLLVWPSVAGQWPVYTRVVAGAFLVVTDPPRTPVLAGVLAAGSALLLAVPPFLALLGKVRPRVPWTARGTVALAIVGGLAAPSLAFAWAIRTGGLVQNLPAAVLLLAIGVALAFAVRRLLAASGETASVGAGGYAAGAALALGFAIALALPGLWMAVGFAVAALALAALNDRQPLPMLRRVAAAFGSTALLRAIVSPVWQGDGAWPVFNSYIIAYGVPAALLVASAWLLGKTDRDRALRTTVISAGLMAALYLLYTIRHGFHGADLVADLDFRLGECGLYVLLALLPALGLFAVRDRLSASVQPGARRLVAGLNTLGLGLLVLLVLIIANPWIDGEITGLPLFDSTFTGFVLPGLALGALAYAGRTVPDWFSARLTAVNRFFAIGLGYLYVLAQARLLFAGQARFLSADTSQPENYAYSAVTLAFGVLLLVIGFRLGSRPTRMASAVFVTLAVLKVFLLDMAELEGLLRALSFIGLGGVLIGIGLAYQRLLFDRRPETLLAPDQAGSQRVVP